MLVAGEQFTSIQNSNGERTYTLSSDESILGDGNASTEVKWIFSINANEIKALCLLSGNAVRDE